MKKTLLVASFFCLSSIAFSQTKNAYVVKKDLLLETQVSKMLYGNFIEVGFGRYENAWSEMLYNCSFEEDKPFIHEWVTYDTPTPQQESWWHTGYETPEWYLHKNEDNKDSNISKIRDYWPALHSQTIIYVTNKSETAPVYFAQDGLFIRKNISYHFSGYFNDGKGFGAEKMTKNPIEITIGFYENKDFSKPIVEKTILVNTIQFNQFSVDLPAMDYTGKATFAIKIPKKTKLGIDLVSLKPSDNFKGWRKDVVEAMKNQVPASIVRFPGGCKASFYNWRDGIGEKLFRPITYNNYFFGSQVSNDIGTVEFIDLCREINAEPQICVPMLFNTAQNAADWVEFCNKPNNALRAKNGHPEPFNVKYWELENEMYRRYDAITYAHLAVEFSKAMKAVDPSIKTIMGDYYIFNPKLKEMLEIAGPYIDFVNNRGGSMKDMQSDLAILKEYNKLHKTDIRLCHTEFRAPPARNMGEVDGLNRLITEEKTSLQNLSTRWAYGMSIIDQMIQYQNLGEQFAFTNFTNYTDAWGENLINVTKEGVHLSSAGKAYEFLWKLQINLPVKFETASPDTNIVLQTAWNSDKTKFTILVENFDTKDHTCSFNISDLKTKFKPTQQVFKVWAPSVNTFNSPKDWDAIKSTVGVSKISSQKFELKVKGGSVMAVVFEKK